MNTSPFKDVSSRALSVSYNTGNGTTRGFNEVCGKERKTEEEEEAKKEPGEAIESPSTEESVIIFSTYCEVMRMAGTFRAKDGCIHAAGVCALKD